VRRVHHGFLYGLGRCRSCHDICGSSAIEVRYEY
jgi:hypothetical protein